MAPTNRRHFFCLWKSFSLDAVPKPAILCATSDRAPRSRTNPLGPMRCRVYRWRTICLLILSLNCFIQLSHAQQPETGLPVYASFHGGGIDNVNLLNGNLHIEIPIITVPQRASPPTTYRFIYDIRSWEINENLPVRRGSSPTWNVGQTSGRFVGWHLVNNLFPQAEQSYSIVPKQCTYSIGGIPHTQNYSVLPGARSLHSPIAANLHPTADLRAPPVFCNDRLQHLFVQTQIHHQLFQFRVLIPQRLRFLRLAHRHPAILRFPGIERVLRSPRPPLSAPPPSALTPRSSALPCADSSTCLFPFSQSEIILSRVRFKGSRSTASAVVETE